jgi:Tfp pilus assembly protein PilV
MLLRKKQLGFSAVELLIILVVVALLGFAGYVVYNRMQNNKAASSSTTSQSTSSSDVKSAPAINSASDLDKASNILDQTDPNPSGDSATLDTQLSAF